MARPSARWWCCLVAQGIVELLVDAGEGVCRPGLVLLSLLWGECGTRVVGVSDLVFAGMLLGPEATRLGLAAPACGWGLVVGCCFWVWCLRIVEWMRASLWSSCVGRMVDVLASGADEGRGRLR